MKPEPQPQLLDSLSEDELLDAVCPPEVPRPSRPAPDSKPGSPLAVRSGEDLLADPALAGDIEWLAAGLFPFGGLSVVYGLPKSGKSTLVMNLAARVLRARPFLGRATECCNILWLDLEQHERLTRRKIEDEGATSDLATLFAYNGLPPSVEDVEVTIEQLGVRFVVVDSLSSLLLLEDENDNAEITRRITVWRNLVHRRHLAFVAVHHARKSEGSFGLGMRGGNAILAISDVAMEVKRLHTESEEDDGRRRLVSVSRYDEANETLTVQRVDTNYEVEPGPGERKRRAILAALAGGPLDNAALAQRSKMRRSAFLDTLSALLAEGRVKRSGEGTHASPYVYGL